MPAFPHTHDFFLCCTTRDFPVCCSRHLRARAAAPFSAQQRRLPLGSIGTNRHICYRITPHSACIAQSSACSCTSSSSSSSSSSFSTSLLPSAYHPSVAPIHRPIPRPTTCSTGSAPSILIRTVFPRAICRRDAAHAAAASSTVFADLSPELQRLGRICRGCRREKN